MGDNLKYLSADELLAEINNCYSLPPQTLQSPVTVWLRNRKKYRDELLTEIRRRLLHYDTCELLGEDS